MACRSARRPRGKPSSWVSAYAIAGWSGAPDANDSQFLAPSTAATSSAGPVAQPIFQPVNEKVLPELEIDSVRSAMPGSVAIGTCSLPSKTRCS